MTEIHNIVNGVHRPAASRRDAAGWRVPVSTPEDVSFALKCVRGAPPASLRETVAALMAIGREARWLGEPHLREISGRTGTPIAFLSAAIGRVNAWLARADEFVARLGDPHGGSCLRRDGVVWAGGGPAAMILAGDSSALTAWALGQALLAGVPVIAKPSNAEPLSAFLFADAVREKGVRPPNVLYLDSGEPGREQVKRIVTGCAQSVVYGEDETVAAIYGALALPPQHRTIPFWSGRSGAVLLDDADVDAAARAVVWGATEDRGSMCNSTKRVYVPRALAEDFERAVAAEAEALRRGDPLDPATEIGRLDPVGRKMAERAAAGADVIYDRDLLVARVDAASPLLTAEIAYPVLAVRAYEPGEDPVRLANDAVRATPSGRALVISVFTRSDDGYDRATAGLRAFKTMRNGVTSRMDYSIRHQGIVLMQELMRPMACA